MDKQTRVLEGITHDQQGIEIGPWFNPLAPKRNGFNCLSLDVYDTTTLLARAAQDQNISVRQRSQIEGVDLVGSSVEIEALVSAKGLTGQVDYILSSHNLEHIPDPIKFLQGCSKTLKIGGILSMVVPDKRTCFDHFRPHTSLGDWLEAYFDHRNKPTLKQVFEAHQLGSLYKGSGVFSLDTRSFEIEPTNNIDSGFDLWQQQIASGHKEYLDAHCWTLTPALFELFVLDLSMLGLLKFKIDNIEGPYGCEFYARLKNMGADWSPEYSKEQYFKLRTDLIRASYIEQSTNTRPIDDAVSDLRELKRQNAELAERLSDIQESTSWKITSPIRKTVTSLRSAVGRHLKVRAS